MRHSTTTHPISWFTEREMEGNLVLQPRFQRRRVWTDRQKSNLIESILLEFPVPEIYMRITTEPDGRSEYIIVDGQQRISAILDFIGVGVRTPLELRYLDENSPWLGYTFSDLTDDQKGTFYGHAMAVRYLQDASYDNIEDLFRRLNKYLTPLNPQELRNATYKGPFLRLSESISEESFWAENRLATPDAIRRMRDIEFVSDLLIGVLHGPQGGSPRILDDYYAMYEDYDREFPTQRECRRRFYITLELIREVLPDLPNTRWTNKTDFYSLFVAIAHLLKERTLQNSDFNSLRRDLDEFAKEISKYQQNERARVPEEVIRYVGAMRRGSSDRTRRGVRHQALLAVISPHFEKRSL